MLSIGALINIYASCITSSNVSVWAIVRFATICSWRFVKFIPLKVKANTVDQGQSLLLTRPIETHFSHSTRVCTILAFIDVLAFSIYLLKAIGTAAYTRFGSEIWSFSPVAFVGSYSIDAVLAEWTVMVRVRMITFVDVNTAFIVNFLVARKALASCVSNWVIRLAKGPHLIGVIRTTTQIGTGHSITNTLVSFQMIPIIALAGKLCSNFE